MFWKISGSFVWFDWYKKVTILCFEELVVNLYKLIHTKLIFEKKDKKVHL